MALYTCQNGRGGGWANSICELSNLNFLTTNLQLFSQGFFLLKGTLGTLQYQHWLKISLDPPE